MLVFESGRELSLNKTSVGNLMRDFGEEDDGWVGRSVEVYAGEVETKSGVMDAVLARAASPAGDAKPAKAGGGASFDDDMPFAPERR